MVDWSMQCAHWTRKEKRMKKVTRLAHTGLLFLLALIATQAQAQAQAQAKAGPDDIQFNLPSSAHWQRTAHHVDIDNGLVKTNWRATAEDGPAQIEVSVLSVSKAKSAHDIQDVMEKFVDKRKDKPIELLAEGETGAGYHYHLYRLGSRSEPKYTNPLMVCFIETPSSYHTIFLNTQHQKLTPAFIAKWHAILAHPKITPVDAAHPHTDRKTATQITLTTAQPIAASAHMRFVDSIKLRLHGAYDGHLASDDVDFDKNQVKIQLYGQVNQDKLLKALSRERMVAFVPAETNEQYTAFAHAARERIHQYYSDHNQKDPQAGFHSNASDPLIIWRTNLDQLRPVLDKVLQDQGIADQVRIATPPPDHDNTIQVYLLDRRQTVITGRNISHVSTGNNPSTGLSGVNIRFDDDGSQALAEWSEQHIGDTLAITANGHVITAATMQGAITGGRMRIGGFALAQSTELKNLISSIYPVDVTQIQVE